MKYYTEKVHILEITVGDTIISKDGNMRTITKQNIKQGFFGKTIHGDSYKLGRELVESVIFLK